MNLDELKAEAARLFPAAVAGALRGPRERNAALRSLDALCWKHYEALGFSCQAHAFEEAVPKVDGRLVLDAWSTAELTVTPWKFRVSCRAFHIGFCHAHLEIHSDGPLPITETGYRSIFVPLATFADGLTPEDFIRAQFPQEAQLSLF